MGDVRWQDITLFLKLMLAFQAQFEHKYCTAPSLPLQVNIIHACMWMVVSFVGALWGEEVPLTDLFVTIKYFAAGEDPAHLHVILSLIRQFKSELGLRYHLFPFTASSSSGLRPRRWIGCVLHHYHN